MDRTGQDATKIVINIILSLIIGPFVKTHGCCLLWHVLSEVISYPELQLPELHFPGVVQPPGAQLPSQITKAHKTTITISSMNYEI
jgi:hypothetical protein